MKKKEMPVNPYLGLNKGIIYLDSSVEICDVISHIDTGTKVICELRRVGNDPPTPYPTFAVTRRSRVMVLTEGIGDIDELDANVHPIDEKQDPDCHLIDSVIFTDFESKKDGVYYIVSWLK